MRCDTCRSLVFDVESEFAFCDKDCLFHFLIENLMVEVKDGCFYSLDFKTLDTTESGIVERNSVHYFRTKESMKKYRDAREGKFFPLYCGVLERIFFDFRETRFSLNLPISG